MTSLTVVFSLSLPPSLWHERGGRAQSFSLMETEKEGPEMHSVSVSLFSALTQNPRDQDTSANYGIPMRHSNQNFTEKSSPLSLCVSVCLCVSLLPFSWLRNLCWTDSVLFLLERKTDVSNQRRNFLIHSISFLSFFHRNRNSDNKPKLPNSAFAALTETKTSSSSENTPKNSAKPRAENGAMDCAQKENLQIHGGGRKEEEVQSLSVPDSKRSEVAEAPALPPLALTTKSTSLHRRKVDAKQIFYAKSRLLFVYVVVSKKACVAAALSRLLLLLPFPSNNPLPRLARSLVTRSLSHPCGALYHPYEALRQLHVGLVGADIHPRGTLIIHSLDVKEILR